MKRRKRINHSTEMSFLEHLTELRNRLFISVVAIFVTTFIGLFFAESVVMILMRPLQKIDLPQDEARATILVESDGSLRFEDVDSLLSHLKADNLSSFHVNFAFPTEDPETPVIWAFGPNPQQDLYFFSPFDPFFLILKAALLLGVTFAIPIWLTQIWRFVAPAFTPTEMRAIRPVFLSSVLLFPAGAAFAYFSMSFILQMVFNTFAIPGLLPRLEITRYVSMILMFMLIFGGVFETPVVIVLLVRMGVVSTKTLRATRHYALLGIAVMSACLTPADPISMLMMALPVCVLYEAAIWISVAVERRIEAEYEKENDDESDDDESDDDDS